MAKTHIAKCSHLDFLGRSPSQSVTMAAESAALRNSSRFALSADNRASFASSGCGANRGAFSARGARLIDFFFTGETYHLPHSLQYSQFLQVRMTRGACAS